MRRNSPQGNYSGREEDCSLTHFHWFIEGVLATADFNDPMNNDQMAN